VIVRVTKRLAVAAAGFGIFLSLMIAVGQAQVVGPLSAVKTIVFDESGAVIPGCEIAFTSDSEKVVSHSETVFSHTGTDGSVTVGLRKGRYTLTTRKPGFVKSDVQFSAPMPDTLRIVLKVDHTPTDGAQFDGVPTSTSELPSVIRPDQQSGESPSGLLLHGDGQRGTIRGVLIGRNGEPAGHAGVMALWLCPETCQIAVSSTTTNSVGEFRFEPVTVGKYLVCSNLEADSQLPCFTDAAVAVAAYCTVEITPEHPKVELQMQVPKRGITTPKSNDQERCRQNQISLH
jgi:hypothetical protein